MSAYDADNLCHFRIHGLIGILDGFDFVIALIGQTSQILPQTHHAVVGGGIRTFLDAVLLGHPTMVLLPAAEGVTDVVGGKSLLIDERTRLGMAQ
ncbi:hypothetical protein LRC537489_36810 [Mycobacterium riyadhense]